MAKTLMTAARTSLVAAALAVVGAAALRADQYSDMGTKDPRGGFPLTAFSAIGSSFAESNRLGELGWNDAQIDAFVEGIRAALKGRPYLFDESAKRASAAMGARLRESGADGLVRPLVAPDQAARYYQQASRMLLLEESDSGLLYGIQEVGKGNRPGPADTVVIGIDARAADGQARLDQLSSARFRVRVADLMPGLREGVQMLAVGSHGTFLVPAKLSFGSGPWPAGVPRGDPILFQLTLIDVESADAAR